MKLYAACNNNDPWEWMGLKDRCLFLTHRRITGLGRFEDHSSLRIGEIRANLAEALSGFPDGGMVCLDLEPTGRALGDERAMVSRRIDRDALCLVRTMRPDLRVGIFNLPTCGTLETSEQDESDALKLRSDWEAATDFFPAAFARAPDDESLRSRAMRKIGLARRHAGMLHSITLVTSTQAGERGEDGLKGDASLLDLMNVINAAHDTDQVVEVVVWSPYVRPKETDQQASGRRRAIAEKIAELLRRSNALELALLDELCGTGDGRSNGLLV